MNQNITFREYKKEDEKFLQDIIRKTWKYDRYFSRKVANRTAKVYLASCLLEKTFTQVALLNNKPVGIIMAKDNKSYKRSFKLKLNLISKSLPILFSSDGRNAVKLYSKIDELDEDLLQNSNKKFDSEMVFFVIDEKCRGLGIGKELFNKAKNYLKEAGAKNFYLFTDTTCNYGFYEHLGLNRIGEKIFDFPNNESSSFYIYEGKIG